MFANPSSAKIDINACVGAWLFDDSGADVVQDISGNENHGNVKGNPKWDNGKFGKAINFDGVDDCIDCGDTDSLDVGIDNFSIALWMKCAKYNPPDWHGAIIYKLDYTAPRHGYIFGVRGVLDPGNQTKPIFVIGLGQDAGAHLFGTSPINDDTWHHIAITVDRKGAMKLYRDGNFESMLDISASSKQNENNAKNFNIGSELGSRGIKGLIDEVAIFKVILAEEDIKKIMDDGLERSFGLVAVLPSDKLSTTWAMVKYQ
jgi:hypothetical protein